MLDLILGYLLIITILIMANTGLFLGDFKSNNVKALIIAVIMAIFVYVIIFISTFFVVDINGWITYIFICLALFIFIIFLYYLKGNSLKVSNFAVAATYYICLFLMSCQSDNITLFSSLLLSMVSIISIIIAFQFSKLLHFAKRPYRVIVGEFMILECILFFIFALTYNSTYNLEYEMFSYFLILTPTYQLIYVIIGIIFVLIIGLYWNDKKLR